MNDKRQRAADLDRAAQESFERSDTDGFLSQWAHGIRAQQLRAQADIDENGGRAQFPGLYEGDRRVNAKLVDGRYGLVWLLGDEEAERFGRRFVPFDNSHDAVLFEGSGRSRVQRDLGLVQRYELAPARAVIRSSGTGLAGAASAYVTVIRTDIWCPVTDEEREV